MNDIQILQIVALFIILGCALVGMFIYIINKTWPKK